MGKVIVILVLLIVLAGAGAAGWWFFLKGPSKAEYSLQADAICKTDNEVTAALTAPDDIADVKDVASKLAESTQRTVTRLRALDQPRGEVGQAASQVVSAFAVAARKAESAAEAAGKEDLVAAEKTVTEVQAAFKEVDDESRSFGLRECGKGGAAAAAVLQNASPGILKKSLIAKADAICATSNKEIEALVLPESLPQLVEFMDKLLGIADRMFSQIKALSVAPADRPTFDAAMADNDQVRAKIAEVREAARAGDGARVEQLSAELDNLGTAANAKMDAFGFKDCGSAAAA